MQKISSCLWFDTEGEEAATFYTSVFPNSRIVDVAHYGSAGPRPEGTVMAVSFELNGQPFVALNGGPEFTFDEAVSFQVHCDSQEEVDSFWGTLSEGGEEGPCGWLKDRYDLSWQIVPTVLFELLGDPDRGEVAAGHGGDAGDEEDRDRRSRAGCERRRPVTGAAGRCSTAYPAGAWADASLCQRPNSFPCGSLQVTNQPMPGTGIGSSASPPSSLTRAAPVLMSSTSK